MADSQPINADAGWSHLMRVLSRTTPARLYRIRHASAGLRALRRKG